MLFGNPRALHPTRPILYLLMTCPRSDHLHGRCCPCGVRVDCVRFRTQGCVQRAMPSWARGRINATVIMAAQWAMALGAVSFGSGCSHLRSESYLDRMRVPPVHQFDSSVDQFRRKAGYRSCIRDKFLSSAGPLASAARRSGWHHI
jgi:hypothetical protein